MKKINFIAILFFAVFAACSQANSPASKSASYSSNAASVNSPAAGSEDQTIKNESGGGGGGGIGSGKGSGRSEPVAQKISLEQADKNQAAPETIERKIIRDADLSLESNAPAEAQDKITSIAESKGGFVVESNQSSSDASSTTRDTVTMTVRVPAAKFNESLDEIRKTGSRVIAENVKGQDVTEEFIDIEARLKTQKALEAQFLEIMKRSNSVEDALQVQREIADVRTEIEKIEGRKHFLENQASLSTIKIRLQTPAAFAGNSKSFFRQLGDAVSTGINGALGFILVLVTALIALLPFLIFIVLPICLVIRYFWRKSKKQKLASEILRDEIKSE